MSTSFTSLFLHLFERTLIRYVLVKIKTLRWVGGEDCTWCSWIRREISIPIVFIDLQAWTALWLDWAASSLLPLCMSHEMLSCWWWLFRCNRFWEWETYVKLHVQNATSLKRREKTTVVMNEIRLSMHDDQMIASFFFYNRLECLPWSSLIFALIF